MLPPSTRFGPYELLRPIGAGGMAETYVALKRGPGTFEQRVCLKRILPAYERDVDFVSQFMEEARLAAQLRHAKITNVLDFGIEEGSHYLTLELIDGMDLRGLLREHRERGERLEPGVAVYLAAELAMALDYAHTGEPGRRPAVVHRDISPSNILVSRAGEIKLTDFGIAHAMGTQRRTASGVVKGKIPYMAPEYALHSQFDGRTDLFAVGVTLYEALAGRRPFDGKNDLETLEHIRDGAHPPLRSLRPDLPEAIEAIVHRLIHADKEARFPSAAALLDALAAAPPPPTAHRALAALVDRYAPKDLTALARAAYRDSGGGTLSGPLSTSPMGGASVELGGHAASLPEPIPSAPDAATRTSHPAFHGAPPPTSGAMSTGEGQVEIGLLSTESAAPALGSLPTPIDPDLAATMPRPASRSLPLPPPAAPAAPAASAAPTAKSAAAPSASPPTLILVLIGIALLSLVGLGAGLVAAYVGLRADPAEESDAPPPPPPGALPPPGP